MSTCELDRELHTQVMKREEARERTFREERERHEEEVQAKLGMGGTEMSKEELKKIIDSDRRLYYRTESLNDKLYIHYKGWHQLKNLDGWTGLKTLYAECNAFSSITGLLNCRQMRSLFLQDNCIQRISGLENCPELWSLNLSGNFIERIEGLENCTGLNTLVIAKNKIGFNGIEDIEKLANTNIMSVDIQENKLEDPDVLPEVFARMKSLRVLYFKGNGAAKKIVNYRKSTTVYCKDLKYLDDRPVFEDDRRQAEAFNRGGIEEQRAETRRQKEEKRDQHEKNMRLFAQMIEDTKRQKKERDAMRLEDKYTNDTDPVEDFEHKSRRLIREWKEENAEDLKDDAKEYAEKCLRTEKGAATSASDAETDDDHEKAVSESRDSATECGETCTSEEPLPAPKEDNRKLVYEDIWDDGPPGSGGPVSAPKVDNRKLVYDDIWDDVPMTGSSASAPSKPSMLSASQGGLAAARSGSAAEGTAAEETAPSWHSKYLEQVSKTQVKLQATAASTQKPIFAPPPRRAEKPADASADSIRPEAPSGSPPIGAGELDEMD